jgi:WD40 repeat protein
LAEAPLHLARIRKSGKGHILCAALSPSGGHVAFSDARRVRLFSLAAAASPEELANGAAAAAAGTPNGKAAGVPEDPSLLRVAKRDLPASLPAACQLAFTWDSCQLIAASPDGRIHVIDIESGSVVRTFEEACTTGGGAMGAGLSTTPSSAAAAAAAATAARGAASSLHCLSPAVSLLKTSPDGQWLAAGNRSAVYLYHLEALRYHARLPALEVRKQRRNILQWSE